VKGKRVPKRTVKIWLLCAELSNGSTEWMELKIAKDASPIKAARYAVANKIADESALRWWVPYFVHKQDRIIGAVKRRASKQRKDEKFGLELPVIILALYGLKSAGYSWRTFCARILREELHFIPCRADMDVWRRAARKETENDIMNIFLSIQMTSFLYRNIRGEF